MDLIGKRFESKGYGWFTVIREEKYDSSISRHRRYLIEFDEVNSVSYNLMARKDHILSGQVKNPFYPSFFNVGYLGNAVRKGSETQYDRWKNMLSRCYDVRSERYNTYGAQGVIVCDRWLCFEYYLEDFTKIDGYDEENVSSLVLDKDIKYKGNKVYSLETCMFVTPSENSKEMNRRFRQRDFTAISPAGEVVEANNQREFAKINNLHYCGIRDVLSGKMKSHRGWKFKYKESVV